MCFGTLPGGTADAAKVGAWPTIRHSARVHQSQSLSEPGIQVRLDLQSGRFHPAHVRSTCAHSSQPASPGNCSRPIFTVDRRRVELSGLAEHPQAHRVARRGDGGDACRRWRQDQRIADRVQAIRAGLLSHRYRGLGHGVASGAGGRTAGAGAGGYRAITTSRRTSSRSSRGCCTCACWAASTSTTAAMRTTI